VAARREVDYVLNGKDNTQGAFDSLKRNITQGQSHFDQLTAKLKDQQGTIGGLMGSIGKFAAAATAALGIAWFGNLITGTAQARAHLNDLSAMGLGTVESLSKLQVQAKANAQDFGVVEDSLQKMIRGLTQGDEETGRAGEAFRRLGIDTKNQNGNWKSAAELTQEAAVKLARYSDGTEKAAFAQAIYGRAGLAMLPILRDMAELGEVQAKTTARQAAEAEEYVKSLKRYEMATEGVAKKIVGEAIPAVTALLEALTETAREVNGTKAAVDGLARDNTLRDWFFGAAEKAAVLLDTLRVLAQAPAAIGGSFKAVAGDLNVLTASSTAVRGDTTQMQAALDARNKTVADANARYVALWEADGRKIERAIERAAALSLIAGQDVADQVSRRFTDVKRVLDASGLGGKVKGELSEAEKAFNSLTDALKNAATEGAKLRAQAANFDQYGNSLRGTNEAVALYEVQSGRFALAVGSESEALKKRYVEQARANDIDLQRVEVLKQVKGSWEALGRAIAETAQRELDIQRDLQTAFAESIADQEFDISLIGKTREQVTLLTAARRIDMQVRKALESLPTDELGGINTAKFAEIMAAGDAAKARILGLVDANQAASASFDSVVSVLREADAAGKSFTEDLLSGGLKGMDIAKRLGDAIKRYIADLLWQLTARPFLIQLAASVTGTSVAGLSQAAGLANGGNTLSSIASGSSLLAGPAAALSHFGTAFSNTVSLFGEFSTNFASAAEFLSSGSFASALGTLGPYALAITAAVKLFEAFADKGENWRAQLGYGANANAYAVNGTFGRVGFDHIAGDDALNREIQKFFESFRGFDERILKTLSQAQETAVRAGIANLTSAREFAFPKGDETAGQQLTLQFVQEYYGAIFKALGPDYDAFASAIANWKGKVEDLIAAIGDMIGVMEVVSSGTIKGLTIPILEEWQRQNETLAQTTQRVLANWANFIDKFGDDSTKFGLITKPFTAAMESLGVTLPTTRAGLFDYVNGLDLADASQRAIYDAVMNNVGAADAYYSALERVAQAQQAAATTQNRALAALMTPSERLAQAQALLASHNITSRESLIAYIRSLDSATESGRAAIAMLTDLTDAYDLVSNANPDLHGLDAFNNRTHQIGGEASRTADAIDQASDALANLSAAAETIAPYIDEAKGHQTAIANRYGADTSVAGAQSTIAALQAQLAALDLTVPTTTDMIADMAATLDPTTVRGMALLRILDAMGLAMDTVAAATERANAAEAAARVAMDGALESLMTDGERLANAQAIVAGRTRAEIEAYIRSIDPATEAGQRQVESLQTLVNAYTMVTAAETARTNALSALFAGLQTDAQKLEAANALLTGAGIDPRHTDLSSLVDRLHQLADQGATVDSLQAIIDAFHQVEQVANNAAAAVDPHSGIASGATERAKYVADVQALFDTLATDAERLVAARALLQSSGLAELSTLDDLREKLRQMAMSGATLDSMQALIDAFRRVAGAADAAAAAVDPHAGIADGAAERRKYLEDVQGLFAGLTTDAERLVLARSTLASSGLSALSTLDDLRERLRQMAMSGATVQAMQDLIDAFHRVGDATKQAVDAAMSAAEDALARADRLASFRAELADTIANAQRTRPGYDYAGYLAGKVTGARGAFTAATTADDRLAAAGRLRDALQGRYQFEFDRLSELHQHEIEGQRQVLEAQKAAAQQGVESARQMGEAFARMGDHARELLLGDMSTLSPEAKFAEARRQYESADYQHLIGAGDAYIAAARAMYGSGEGYAAVFDQVQAKLASMGSLADPMLAAAQAQEASLGSIDQAIANLDTSWSPAMLQLTDQFVGELQALSDQMLEDEATARAEADLRAREAVRLAGEQRDLLQTANAHLAELVAQQRRLLEQLAEQQSQAIRTAEATNALLADRAFDVSLAGAAQ